MNKTLTALLAKISRQLKESGQSLIQLTEELAALQKKQTEKQNQLTNACAIPAVIHPEQEISRLNFIVRCQQELQNFELENRELENKKSIFKERLLRLNLELKMLEKYLLNQKNIEQKKRTLVEQNYQDEWVLQRSNQHENK